MAKDSTRVALLEALERIVTGQAKRSSGKLTAVALAEEAGVGHASLYRCREALQALQKAKLGRSTGSNSPLPPIMPGRSSERALREVIHRLANRILLLEAIVDERDVEIGQLRKLIGNKKSNVVTIRLDRDGR